MPSPTVTNPTYTSGYGGGVVIDPAGADYIIPISSWKADHKVSTWDATNSTSAGAQVTQRAIESMNGSFDAMWAYTSGAPPMLAGTIYPIKLSINSTESYTFLALITSVAIDMQVKGGVTYTCSFESNGAITVAT